MNVTGLCYFSIILLGRKDEHGYDELRIRRDFYPLTTSDVFVGIGVSVLRWLNPQKRYSIKKELVKILPVRDSFIVNYPS